MDLTCSCEHTITIKLKVELDDCKVTLSNIFRIFTQKKQTNNQKLEIVRHHAYELSDHRYIH
jgi:hypothetical protein